jgi:hypothetical protein
VAPTPRHLPYSARSARRTSRPDSSGGNDSSVRGVASGRRRVVRHMSRGVAPTKSEPDFNYQYNDRWVWPPPASPWPMAIQTQEQMKQTHGHLKNYTAVARATTSSSRVLGGGWPGWWLHPRHPRNAVVDHVSTSPCGQAPSPTATAGTCQAALPRPSVLPGAALIACANKTHTVKGDGVAEACAVRTHAAFTSTLLPGRPEAAAAGL